MIATPMYIHSITSCPISSSEALGFLSWYDKAKSAIQQLTASELTVVAEELIAAEAKDIRALLSSDGTLLSTATLKPDEPAFKIAKATEVFGKKMGQFLKGCNVDKSLISRLCHDLVSEALAAEKERQVSAAPRLAATAPIDESDAISTLQKEVEKAIREGAIPELQAFAKATFDKAMMKSPDAAANNALDTAAVALEAKMEVLIKGIHNFPENDEGLGKLLDAVWYRLTKEAVQRQIDSEVPKVKIVGIAEHERLAPPEIAAQK